MAKDFSFCARHYLSQWKTHDSRYHHGINAKERQRRLETLAEAAGWYKVARNLPTKYDIGRGLPRYGPALAALEELNGQRITSANMVQKVLTTQTKISKRYGSMGSLSFTTKMLWMIHRHPIIIFDSMARKALGALSDYAAYVELWREECRRHASEIDSACAAYAGTVSSKSDTAVVTEQWFKDRVFDIYLWHMAAK